MKKVFWLLTALFISSAIFAQTNETKHPVNGKTIIIKEDGTWEYKVEYGEFTDTRDKKIYKTVTIGNQVWFAENLAYLPKVSQPEENSGYWVYGYKGTSVTDAKKMDNYSKFGVLYNFETAKNSCPTGWHLPEDEEWKELCKSLETTTNLESSNLMLISGVGEKIKGLEYWYEGGNYEKGTNVSGFNGVAAGHRDRGGWFEDDRKRGYWWTASQYGKEYGLRYYIDYSHNDLVRTKDELKQGFSVRCVKD